MQEILVLISFIVAAGYLTSVFVKIFSRKKSCDSCGSGGCSTIDFDKIEKQLTSQHKQK